MTSYTISPKRFPPPRRAPGYLDELASEPSADAGAPADATRAQRRVQRSFDGWLAGRIRKQSRHWRQH